MQCAAKAQQCTSKRIPHFNTNETDSILDQEGQTIDRVSVTSLHNIVNELYSGFSLYGLLRQ